MTEAVIHYNRPDADYDAWGLHLFGADALAPGEGTPDYGTPTPFEGTDSFGVFHEIGIADDTKRVGFIVHGRPPEAELRRQGPAGCGRPLLQPARHTGDLAPPG